MTTNLTNIKYGLALVMLGLLFGIGLGITFGVNEDFFKEYVAQGVAAHPELHDAQSQAKIWRYAQRAHFHATGIATFSIGLLLLVVASGLKETFKKIAAVLIGLGCFYPFAWLSMFLLAPSIGTDAAHSHPTTELFTYIGTGGLLLGLAVLLANLFLGLFSESNDRYQRRQRGQQKSDASSSPRFLPPVMASDQRLVKRDRDMSSSVTGIGT